MQLWRARHAFDPGRRVAHLSGRSLQRARAHLSELASFERAEGR